MGDTPGGDQGVFAERMGVTPYRSAMRSACARMAGIGVFEDGGWLTTGKNRFQFAVVWG